MLLAIPEHKVHLPGGGRPSQNDLWVIASCDYGLVSIAVEGKVSETFGPTLLKWEPDSSPGKQERLDFLCAELDLETPLPDDIRYQLLHRTVSAIIEAKKFNAKYAMMLVHSFSPNDQWFQDYKRFVSLFKVPAAPDQVIPGGVHSGISLFFAWVRGGERYLKA